MARLPPTPEDLARGTRLKELRDHFGWTQGEVYPRKHQQVLNAEKGKNKLGGQLLLVYSEKFGVPPKFIQAYARGILLLEDLLAIRESISRREQYRESIAALPPDERKPIAIFKAVMDALRLLDGVSAEEAMGAISEVALEHGDALATYVAARLKLQAEAGGMLPQERVIPGPDVTTKKSAGSRRRA